MASRPPSEQGVEYRTLDLLEELGRRVDELAAKPAMVVNAGGNWWDVVPELDGVVMPYVSMMQLPTQGSSGTLLLRAQTMADRMELTLMLNHAYVLWQRALFYSGGPPRG